MWMLTCDEYQENFGTCGYVRDVTDSMMFAFRAERAVSPLVGSELWVVLDPELVPHREAGEFLGFLRGAGRSPHTIRACAGRAALSWAGARLLPHAPRALPGDLAA